MEAVRGNEIQDNTFNRPNQKLGNQQGDEVVLEEKRSIAQIISPIWESFCLYDELL
jgi:hypothetical protein